MSTNEIMGDTVAPVEEIEVVIDPAVSPSSYFLPYSYSTSYSKPDDEKKDKLYVKKLYQAALMDDWDKVSYIFGEHPYYFTARISPDGDTALHIAAAADSFMFVQNLVNYMNQEEYYTIKNNDGNTAFCLAAVSGNVELAKKILCRNYDLLMIPGKNGMLPLHMAALSGHKEMVEFLYGATKYNLHEEDRIELFHTLIRTGLHDVALNLLQENPRLAIAREKYYGETALHILARMPMKSSIFADQNQQGSLKRCVNFNLFSVSNKLRQEKLPSPALELVKWLWKQVIDLDDSEISEIIETPSRLIFVAAAQGNIEFLTIIIREYPQLILKVDENKYSIFHVAVLNRQKDIFKLIYEISPSSKKSILQYKDDKENNILHLAGMLAPPDRLNTVTGVALQLLEELLWFKKVSTMVHPLDAEAKNSEGKTPRALFIEKHRELKEKGERWMKDTANSSMIVATLIATVVFAAVFTIPGGTKEETGTPHFIQRVSFITFVISDAVSLVSSACSILTFLSILTSRYAEEDFLSVLPRKLVTGLSTLLLSIAAMMVVFCATIFIIFKDGMIWVPILVSVIASLPVILFTKQQWRLLSDVARSTFQMSSLFKSSKRTLFDDKGKVRKPNKVKYIACEAAERCIFKLV